MRTRALDRATPRACGPHPRARDRRCASRATPAANAYGRKRPVRISTPFQSVPGAAGTERQSRSVATISAMPGTASVASDARARPRARPRGAPRSTSARERDRGRRRERGGEQAEAQPAQRVGDQRRASRGSSRECASARTPTSRPRRSGGRARARTPATSTSDAPRRARATRADARPRAERAGRAALGTATERPRDEHEERDDDDDERRAGRDRAPAFAVALPLEEDLGREDVDGHRARRKEHAEQVGHARSRRARSTTTRPNEASAAGSTAGRTAWRRTAARPPEQPRGLAVPGRHRRERAADQRGGDREQEAREADHRVRELERPAREPEPADASRPTLDDDAHRREERAAAAAARPAATRRARRPARSVRARIQPTGMPSSSARSAAPAASSNELTRRPRMRVEREHVAVVRERPDVAALARSRTADGRDGDRRRVGVGVGSDGDVESQQRLALGVRRVERLLGHAPRDAEHRDRPRAPSRGRGTTSRACSTSGATTATPSTSDREHGAPRARRDATATARIGALIAIRRADGARARRGACASASASAAASNQRITRAVTGPSAPAPTGSPSRRTTGEHAAHGRRDEDLVRAAQVAPPIRGRSTRAEPVRGRRARAPGGASCPRGCRRRAAA